MTILYKVRKMKVGSLVEDKKLTGNAGIIVKIKEGLVWICPIGCLMENCTDVLIIYRKKDIEKISKERFF